MKMKKHFNELNAYYTRESHETSLEATAIATVWTAGLLVLWLLTQIFF